MRLALNFQRVDPSRGGAETYVADLCRSLVRRGHRVDLYAESWREGVLPGEVRCIAVEAPGRTRLARTWNFARNSEARARPGLVRLHGRPDQHLAPRRHHPPGGRASRQPARPTPRRFARRAGSARSTGWASWPTPSSGSIEAIERRQYDPDRQAQGRRRQQHGPRHTCSYHHVPRTRIHRDPQRHRRRPPAGRPARRGPLRFRNQLGLEPSDLVGLFVGHNFRLKGLKPLLTALARRKRDRPGARPIHLLVCGGGKAAPHPPDGPPASAWSGRSTSLGFVPDIRACYWSSDFFVLPTYYDPCSLVVLEALACGLPSSRPRATARAS